jgi:hypothetical protein
MAAEWVTVDMFSAKTGINKEEAQRRCRSNEWPQGIAWMYYSEKIRLISLDWWGNKWQETARAYAKQQRIALKSNSLIEVKDAANASNVSQLLQTLER